MSLQHSDRERKSSCKTTVRASCLVVQQPPSFSTSLTNALMPLFQEKFLIQYILTSQSHLTPYDIKTYWKILKPMALEPNFKCIEAFLKNRRKSIIWYSTGQFYGTILGFNLCKWSSKSSKLKPHTYTLVCG